MSSPARVSYEEAGGKPGPLRAALLEEARKHLDKPKIRYVIMAAGDKAKYCDWENVEISESSRAGALVALFDFLNSNLRVIQVGVDDFADHHDHYLVRVKSGKCLEECVRARVATAQENYFEGGAKYTDFWLAEWPEETRRASVPELRVQTKAARD